MWEANIKDEIGANCKELYVPIFQGFVCIYKYRMYLMMKSLLEILVYYRAEVISKWHEELHKLRLGSNITLT